MDEDGVWSRCQTIKVTEQLVSANHTCTACTNSGKAIEPRLRAVDGRKDNE